MRVWVWALHLSLPLLGLWLLLARPQLDVHWEHHLGHFLLVGATAAASFGVAVLVRREARARADARLTLIALAFSTAAAFLFLHGFATPQVLLGARTSGFVLAAGVGLLLAGVFVAWSALELWSERAARVLRLEPWLFGGLVVLVAGWAAASLLPIPWLGTPLDAAAGPLLAPLAIVGVPLYLFGAVRYWQRYRRRPAVMLVSLLTAFALLAEALVAVAMSRGWALSWWLWHLLMLAGFGLVAYSARVQERREGSSATLFAGAALDETVRRVREEHRAALTELLDHLDRPEGAAAAEAAVARIADRFGLTEAQGAVLEGAAHATHEVEQLRRQVDALFHLYVSPDVADTILRDPSRAQLGGSRAEVTVLFADLRGFTSFAEHADPEAVVALLNRYYDRLVPIVLGEGGTVVQFVGDALMALFNAPTPLADHAGAAARAGLRLQRAIAEEVAGRRDLPRFRVGINTGPALVGNVGGQVRNFTAIGDTTNLAARLEAIAAPGEVVIGAATHAALGARAVVRPLGPVTVAGRSAPADAYVLQDLREDRSTVSAPEEVRS